MNNKFDLWHKGLKQAVRLNKDELTFCKTTDIGEVNSSRSPFKMEKIFKSMRNGSFELYENLPSRIIRKLFFKHISDPYCSSFMLGEIAAHDNTPIDILRTLARIGDTGVLLGLALSKKMTKDIAITIMNRAQVDVAFERVKKNRVMSVRILRMIQKEKIDEYFGVLEHLIENHSTPICILRRMLKTIPNKDLVRIIKKEFICRKKQR